VTNEALEFLQFLDDLRSVVTAQLAAEVPKRAGHSNHARPNALGRLMRANASIVNAKADHPTRDKLGSGIAFLATANKILQAQHTQPV
jgi:hypothetical protein